MAKKITTLVDVTHEMKATRPIDLEDDRHEASIESRDTFYLKRVQKKLTKVQIKKGIPPIFLYYIVDVDGKDMHQFEISEATFLRMIYRHQIVKNYFPDVDYQYTSNRASGHGRHKFHTSLAGRN